MALTATPNAQQTDSGYSSPGDPSLKDHAGGTMSEHPKDGGAADTTNDLGSTKSPRWIQLGIARAPDSYGLLLALIIIDYILLSINWEGGLQLVVSTVFVGLTGLLGFHTSGVRGAMLRVVRIAVAISVLASIVAAISGTDRGQGVVLVVVGLVTLSTPIAVMVRLVKHERVTAETLLGAVCVYVLIGLMFAYLDLSIHLLSGRFFTQTGQHSEPDFVYYSFITLTTVGYGDLTPTTGLPRTMAVTEALVGQVFLVVLVARLVAMYVPGSLADRRQRLVAARLASGDPETTDDPDPNDSAFDDRGESATADSDADIDDSRRGGLRPSEG